MAVTLSGHAHSAISGRGFMVRAMKNEFETLPSGKTIVREFGDDGQLLKESHSYGALDIGCSMTYLGGRKTEEIYFAKKRLVRRSLREGKEQFP